MVAVVKALYPAAQHFSQKRADVCRIVNAKYAWPRVSGFCSRISRAQIGGRDRFLNRVVGFKLREQAGHLECFADLGWHSAEFEVSCVGTLFVIEQIPDRG